MDFEIPVALFLFKRKETVFKILDVISKIKPKKIYLLSDGGRNQEEHEIVKDVRISVENYINWDCEIIKKYSEENIGVYNNIGGGAKWVFEREKCAIFLEDDNLPEITFFRYCEEMLIRYKDNDRILWVLGTNYLGEFETEDDSSYMFTRHMLPCGWASWSDKFLKYYDGNLELLNDDAKFKLKSNFISKQLYRQELIKYYKTKYILKKNVRLSSWDHQIGFSLRYYNIFGVSPKVNQIRNIGVDSLSTHGGNSLNKTMTNRFCEIKTKKIQFPLIHPKKIELNVNYEKRINNVVLLPFFKRNLVLIMQFIKPLIGLNKNQSFVAFLKEKKIIS